MSLQLIFELRLFSDYHVGSGHRRGRSDSALLRDGDGTPTVRGTTLAALLRDGLLDLLEELPPDRRAAMRLCRSGGNPASQDEYCRQHDPNDSLCPVCRLFGSPAQPKRWWIDSARPSALATPRLPIATGDWGAQAVMRVRVSPRTRRAAPQQLFSEEEGDARLRLQFTATRLANDDHQADEAALLVAAARMVRVLGSARRRGRGECALHVSACEGASVTKPEAQSWDDYWLDQFKARWLDALPSFPAPSPRGITVPAIHPGETPLRFRLIARLDEPLLVAQRSEAANEYAAQGFIPGTEVLGALANLALAQWGMLTPGTEAHRNFAALFCRGGIAVSFLYPTRFEREHLIPLIPMPRDLMVCEQHPEIHINRKTDRREGLWGLARERDPKCPICRESVDRALSEELGEWLDLGNVKRAEVKRREEMHPRINRRTARAQSGNLFGYVALEAGQYFLGELTCRGESAWQVLQSIWEADRAGVRTLWLGKGIRRGYGRTRIVMEPLAADAAGDWVGQPLAARVSPGERCLVMTLLTDAILPDTWGRCRAGLAERAVEGASSRLNGKWLAESLRLPLTIVDEYARAREVDAFNTFRLRPRFRDVAVMAGSTVGFDVDSSVTDEQLMKALSRAETEGIGVRRAEGFGRVAFNLPIYRGETLKLAQAPEEPKVLRTQGEHFLQAEVNLRTRWARELDELLEDKEGGKRLREMFDDARWAAPARWLFTTGRDLTAEEIMTELGKWGKAENLLGQALPGREKKPFFESDGADGFQKALRKMLQQLQSQTEMKTYPENQKRLWAIGVELIAERILLAAEQARSEEASHG